MAIERVTPQRDDLRNELVAIIAAGRELSPEHDYMLADIYLDLTKHRQATQPWHERILDGSGGMRALVGIACLAFALLAFSMLAFGARPDGDRFGPARFDQGGPSHVVPNQGTGSWPLYIEPYQGGSRDPGDAPSG